MNVKPFGMYKRVLEAAQTFQKFIIYPEPSLPTEIINEMDASLEKSLKERKERYDLFAYKDSEIKTLSTEKLEDLGVIVDRDIDGVYCNYEEDQALQSLLKKDNFYVIIHHTHIFDDVPSIEDLTYPRELGFPDMSVISRPRKPRLFIDVNKLKQTDEEEIFKSLNTLTELLTPPIFLLFGPKVVSRTKTK